MALLLLLYNLALPLTQRDKQLKVDTTRARIKEKMISLDKWKHSLSRSRPDFKKKKKKSQMSAVRAVVSCLNRMGLNLQSPPNRLRMFIDPLSCGFYTVAARLKQPWYDALLTATRIAWRVHTGPSGPLERSCKFGVCQCRGCRVTCGWGAPSFPLFGIYKELAWKSLARKRERCCSIKFENTRGRGFGGSLTVRKSGFLITKILHLYYNKKVKCVTYGRRQSPVFDY